ncbi:hypothetical protein M2284_002642 [Rhodococcus sp. LBL1]|nr:hypothetical protein [Rhodococcus sp. LBL1]MDH6684026.1 hypothetical protein [Rhodococcus sp. LBL2]
MRRQANSYSARMKTGVGIFAMTVVTCAVAATGCSAHDVDNDATATALTTTPTTMPVSQAASVSPTTATEAPAVSCEAPQVTLEHEQPELSRVLSSAGEAVTWVTDNVVVRVTNRSQNKIATTGVQVDIDSGLPPLRRGSNPDIVRIPDPITDHPWNKFQTIDPGQTHEFKAKAPLLTVGLRGGRPPQLTAVLNDWHFNNADVDRRCLAEHPGLHE